MPLTLFIINMCIMYRTLCYVTTCHTPHMVASCSKHRMLLGVDYLWNQEWNYDSLNYRCMHPFLFSKYITFPLRGNIFNIPRFQDNRLPWKIRYCNWKFQLGLCADNFLSGRPAGRWQKLMLNRYQVGLIFIGSKTVQVSMQPDNPFVNNANFFPWNFRARVNNRVLWSGFDFYCTA